MALDWIVHQVATGILAVVFALALVHKLRGYPRFRASLEAYGLVPVRLLGIVAPFVVLLEMLAVLCLLLPAGPGPLPAFALLAVYTSAMLVNLLRGRSYIDCGCGDQPTPLSGWLVARNGLLMALAWPHEPAAAHGSAGAWLLVVGIVLVAIIFYLTLEQLLANRGLVETDHG